MKNNPIQPLSLRKNFSWILLGNIVYAACQWLMLVLIAKLGTAEMVGQFVLSLAITAPVFMFANLQLRAIQATDKREQYPFGHFLGIRLIMTTLALFTIGIITLVGGYDAKTSWIILLMGASKGFESISDVIHGLLQKHERMDRISISLMIKGLISLLLLCGLLWTTGSVVYSVLGLSVSGLILLVFYDVVNARQYTHIIPNFKLRSLWPLMRLSLPLGVVMILVSLNTNIPRYFIKHYLGTEALGYFAAITYIMVTGNMVISALGQSATPRMAKFYMSWQRKEFQNLLIKLLGIATFLGMLGFATAVLFGRELLILLYQPSYASYASLLVLIMLAAGFEYISSMLGYSMTAAHRYKIQPILFFLVAAVSVISNAALVPTKGVEGAGYAVIITGSVQLLGSLLINIYALSHITKKEHYQGVEHEA